MLPLARSNDKKWNCSHALGLEVVCLQPYIKVVENVHDAVTRRLLNREDFLP